MTSKTHAEIQGLDTRIGRQIVLEDGFQLLQRSMVDARLFTYAAKNNFKHIWSVAGQDSRPRVSNTFLQPFLAYNTESAWMFTVKEHVRLEKRCLGGTVQFSRGQADEGR